MNIRARWNKAAIAPVLAVVLGAATLTGCADSSPEPVAVGYSAAPELRVAAAIYVRALAATGVDAELADRPAAEVPRLVDEIASGQIDFFPAYSGALLTALVSDPPQQKADEVIVAVNRALPQGVSIGDPTGAGDRRQLLVSDELRARLDSDSGDPNELARCDRLPAGLPILALSPPDAESLAAIKRCGLGRVEQVSDAARAVDRVRTSDAVALLTASESAGVTDLDGVQALSSSGAPRAQDLVPVFRSARLGKSQTKALSRIAGELTTADLAALAARVKGGEPVDTVAGSWLAAHPV